MFLVLFCVFFIFITEWYSTHISNRISRLMICDQDCQSNQFSKPATFKHAHTHANTHNIQQLYYRQCETEEQSPSVCCQCCKRRRKISITKHTCNTCATGLSGSSAETFVFFHPSLSHSLSLFSFPVLMETKGKEQINRN